MGGSLRSAVLTIDALEPQRERGKPSTEPGLLVFDDSLHLMFISNRARKLIGHIDIRWDGLRTDNAVGIEIVNLAAQIREEAGENPSTGICKEVYKTVTTRAGNLLLHAFGLVRWPGKANNIFLVVQDMPNQSDETAG